MTADPTPKSAMMNDPALAGGDGLASGTGRPDHSVIIGLSAVIIAVHAETPKVQVVPRPYAPLQSGEAGAHHFMDEDGTAQAGGPGTGDWYGLPFGPFDPAIHRTLEIGLRSWVEEHAHLQVGYVEQLYTFGDRGRYLAVQGIPRIVSVGYLALTRLTDTAPGTDRSWVDWYRYFPWEDWRDGEPGIISGEIRRCLKDWTDASQGEGQKTRRWNRVRACFGFDGVTWDEEKVLERYELLYEAGLVAEAVRDRRDRAKAQAGLAGGLPPDADDHPGPGGAFGEPMQFDHRRILATAMGRLRGKLKYRPVVFELMPATFTLFELQRTVEAISGVRVHKQNFRRLVERSGLVEGTDQTIQTAGRPAKAFRFRREVLTERSTAGVRLAPARADRGRKSH